MSSLDRREVRPGEKGYKERRVQADKQGAGHPFTPTGRGWCQQNSLSRGILPPLGMRL